MFGLKPRPVVAPPPPNTVDDDRVVPISTTVLHLQDQALDNAAFARHDLEKAFTFCPSKLFDRAQQLQARVRFGIPLDPERAAYCLVNQTVVFEFAPPFTALGWSKRPFSKEVPHFVRGIAWVNDRDLPCPVLELRDKYVRYRSFFVEYLSEIHDQQKFELAFATFDTVGELLARKEIREEPMLADMAIEGAILNAHIGNVRIPPKDAPLIAAIVQEMTKR